MISGRKLFIRDIIYGLYNSVSDYFFFFFVKFETFLFTLTSKYTSIYRNKY